MIMLNLINKSPSDARRLPRQPAVKTGETRGEYYLSLGGTTIMSRLGLNA